MENKPIAFIGCGNMGSSLIGGLLADNYPARYICGVETDATRREAIAQRFAIEVYADFETAVSSADIILLAVKPQQLAAVCASIKPHIKPDSLIVSIVAGIKLCSLQNWLGEQQAIVRVMPNTPALIGAGASALIANDKTPDDQRNEAEVILRSVGLTLWLDDERQMDAVTAVSGSGPAYFFLVIEVMQKAARQLGLNEEQAQILTLQTAFGATRMALESEHDAATLRQQVTSPGGTTEQALQVLNAAGLDTIFADALQAARDQSVKLAELFAEGKS